MAQRRFLILLPLKGYYRRIARGLGAALEERGAAVAYQALPVLSRHRSREADPKAISREIARFEPTDTFTINVPKAALPIPPSVLHHCWVQDLYDWIGAKRSANEKIWMWTSHWCPRWGGTFLPPATDYHKYFSRPESYHADIAFVGFLPNATIRMPANPQIDRALTALFPCIHEKILTAGDYFTDWDYAKYLLRYAELRTNIYVHPPLRDTFLYHICNRLLRHVQRKELMDFLVPLAERRGWRLALAGRNWVLSPLYRPHTRGYIEPGPPLARFLQGAKVVLHVNGDTNFHVRVLECMGAGAFVLAKSHITDGQQGGLRSLAGPEVVPTFEDFEDLEEKLNRYLEDDKARREAIEKGVTIIRSYHTFANRVDLLLKEKPQSQTALACSASNS